MRLHGWSVSNVGWGNLPRVPRLREHVWSRLDHAAGAKAAAAAAAAADGALVTTSSLGAFGSAGGGTGAAATRTVVLFTRADAAGRRLLLKPARRAATLAALGVTHVVRGMPAGEAPLAAQAALYRAADALIAPHGAAAANTLFMRAGSVHIELQATCAHTCTGNCVPRHLFVGRAGWKHAGEVTGLPAERACSLLQSFFAPFHAVTGVRYHVIPACVGGARAWTRACASPLAFRAQHTRDIPLGGPTSDTLVRSIRAILRDPVGSVEANATRVAPFALGACEA